MSQEFWLSLFPESVEVDPSADLPSFEPTPAESFEEDFEGLGLDNEDVDFPEPLDGPPLPYRDVSTPSSLRSSSASMYSMGLTEDSANSEYSSMTHSTASFQSPFDAAFREVNFGPESIGVDPKHTSMFTDPAGFADPNGFLGSLGTLGFSPDILEPVRVLKAQVDDGPYRPSVGISPHSLFTTAFQGSPPAVPTGSSVGDFTTTQTSTGPVRKKFICSECGHLSARKHNLKTHMETHNPNRPKPFVCPESDCNHPFTRKHDLKRHLESMHGDGAK